MKFEKNFVKMKRHKNFLTAIEKFLRRFGNALCTFSKYFHADFTNFKATFEKLRRKYEVILEKF